MSEHTKLERALRILQRLMTHEHVTVRELYDLFDGRESVRALQRVLTSIQNANIPLKISRGPHGEKYYSLHRAFDYIPISLSSDEILAAVVLGQFAEYFDGTTVGTDIRRALEKIDQLVPPGSVAVTHAFHDLSESFLVHEPGRASLSPRGPLLRDLFHSILDRRVCHVTYAASKKSYNVHPYSLLLHGGLFYAVVYHPRHANWIYLALPRIEKLIVREETFERDPEFRLRDFLRHNFGLWSDTPELVRIHFNRTVVPSIADRLWHPSQQLETLPGGDALLTMRVGLSSELLAWVLRWEHYAEVLEPAGFRQRVEEALQKSLARYRENVAV